MSRSMIKGKTPMVLLGKRTPRLRTPKLLAEILRQRDWIKSCGGDLAGYKAKYKEPGHPDCYGEGGTAIYNADMAALTRLTDRLEARLKKNKKAGRMT